MQNFRKAARLEEVAAQATLQPLKPGDARYVNLARGQSSKDLQKLRLDLEDQRAEDARYARIAFSGHRGCGKTTLLYRLEEEIKPRFASVHLEPDESLLRDLDYTELLLWLVERVAAWFDEEGIPLDARRVDDVTAWFATIAQEDIKKLKTEAEASIETTGKAKTGIYWLSLEVLGRLKSVVQGSIERRREVRRELHRYSSELVERVNFLLDDAARVLKRSGRAEELLLVQDNLDRLTTVAAHRLFIENGELLKDLRAHTIFTAPVPLMLAPGDNLGLVFDQKYMMPTIKVAGRNGRPFAPGVDVLVELIGARVDLDAVFGSREAVRLLARMSGGSVRDLIRLLASAQLSARVDDKKQIDTASVEEAVKGFRIEFERTLVPGSVYYPLLAEIHRRKQLEGLAEESVEEARRFFSELLLMGAVLEYNGDDHWHDVHPTVREIRMFQDAIRQDPAEN